MSNLDIKSVSVETAYNYVETAKIGDTIIINENASLIKSGTEWLDNVSDTTFKNDVVCFLIKVNKK